MRWMVLFAVGCAVAPAEPADPNDRESVDPEDPVDPGDPPKDGSGGGSVEDEDEVEVEDEPREPDPVNGEAVYHQHCMGCHGHETDQAFGGECDVYVVEVDLLALEFDAVVEQVQLGSYCMPAFGQDQGGVLSNRDIRDVAAYVLSL